jgi:hypothetical protein
MKELTNEAYLMIEEANGLSLKDEMNLIPGKAEL